MSSNLAGTSTSGSLRPRNRRLISIEGDAGSRARSLSPVASVNEEATSITSSRDASPLPAAHPSRATSNPRSTPGKGGAASTKGYQAPSLAGKNTLFAPGYWETSWSSIQGIASTLLGNDPQSSTASTRRKPPLSQSAKYSVRASADKWGPSGGGGERHIAQGSQEDRLAQLQAKKREVLLQANGHSEPDRMGQYKRRMSSDDNIASAGEDHSDTPVYVHYVQKSDTLAGLSIRYNCSQSAIRRANRLYPNDTIQVRKKAYLPVDSCSVRGRKVAPPTQATKLPSLDLLGEAAQVNEDNVTTPTRPTADWSIGSPTAPTSNPQPISAFTTSPTLSATTSATNQSTVEPPQVHDSWVEIDHIPDPVEIVRIPCHSLGFFPPRRRRSASYTDTTPPHSPSLSGQPTVSSLYTSSPSRSTSQHGEIQQRHGRSASSPQQYSDSRGPSNAASYFLEALSGPGGVGSLSRTASPGPAMDRLNEFWDTKLTPAAANAAARAAAAAGVQLPLRTGTSAPTSNALRTTTGLGGGMSASRTSLDSVTSAGSEIAGRVEGWVRRTGAMRSPAPGLADSDLIELQEGGGGEPSTDGRQRRGSVSGREIEEERLLRERFPPRGRVFEEQPRSKAKSKEGR